MFSTSRLKLCTIICYEKSYFFKKKFEVNYTPKKTFENTFFKVIQVIFKQY